MEAPDEFSLHEVLHVTSVIMELFDREITQHNAIKTLKAMGNKELAKLVEDIGDNLHSLYQRLGDERFKED